MARKYDSAYNKAWSKLQRNIRKVIREGYVIDFNVPSAKTKRPNQASINRLEKLNQKVLQESKVYVEGRGDITRKKAQLIKGREERLAKKTRSGKTLTSKAKNAFISETLGMVQTQTKGLTLESLKKIEIINRSIFDIVAYHGNNHASDKRGLEKWANIRKQELAEFLNKDPAVINEALKNIDMTRLDFSNYNSDGVGIRPFTENFDSAMQDLLGSDYVPDFQESWGDPEDIDAEKLISRGYSVEKMKGW